MLNWIVRNRVVRGLFFLFHRNHPHRLEAVVSWLNNFFLAFDLWGSSAQRRMKFANDPTLDSYALFHSIMYTYIYIYIYVYISKIAITGSSLKVSTFSFDFVTSRTGYCKRVMISAAESKRLLRITNCTKKEGECILQFLDLADLAYTYIYLKYLVRWQKLLGSTRHASIALSYRNLSLLVDGWWGQGIARAFTRSMIMKKKKAIYIYIYISHSAEAW